MTTELTNTLIHYPSQLYVKGVNDIYRLTEKEIDKAHRKVNKWILQTEFGSTCNARIGAEAQLRKLVEMGWKPPNKNNHQESYIDCVEVSRHGKTGNNTQS